jgi:hypothetical protein
VFHGRQQLEPDVSLRIADRRRAGAGAALDEQRGGDARDRREQLGGVMSWIQALTFSPSTRAERASFVT